MAVVRASSHGVDKHGGEPATAPNTSAFSGLVEDALAYLIATITTRKTQLSRHLLIKCLAIKDSNDNQVGALRDRRGRSPARQVLSGF